MSKIFFSTNLKYLRGRKGQSQETLANNLSMGRSKIDALEQGRTKTCLPEDLMVFSRYYKISIDTLLSVDLSKLQELQLRELEAGNDLYLRGGNLRVLAISVDRNNEENVEMVPIKAKAGYRAGYNDPAYIGQLPKFSMPNLPKGKSVRIFPTEGDSMLPIPEDSLIVTEYVEDLTSIKTGTLCIVVLNGTGPDFVFKSVENRLNEDRTFILHSLNEMYKPYAVQAEDVLEVWKFVSYVSNTVPGGNITMSHIANALQEIKVNVASLVQLK